MDSFESVDLLECPCCGGAGIIEDEGGWCVYIQCLDCGAHTAAIPYETEEGRLEAARTGAMNWNARKVIRPGPGE